MSDIITIEQKIVYNNAMMTRGNIKIKCAKMNISFDEKINFGAKGMWIETIIGGEDTGLVVNAIIHPADLLPKRMSEHYEIVKKEFETSLPYFTEKAKTL